MTASASILVVNGSARDADMLMLVCSNLNYAVEGARDSAEAIELYEAARHQIVLTEYRTEPEDAIELIKQMQFVDPRVHSIIVTDQPDAALIDFLSEADSVSLLLKPVQPSELLDHIRVATQKDRGATEQLGEIAMFHRMDQCLPLLGCSAEIAKVRKQIVALALSRQPILIEGPRGVGKPDVAKFIHYSGGYSESEIVLCPFEKMDREAIETRFLSADGRWGTDVERARHGTLVLRQIESIPLPIQHVLAKQFDALLEQCRVISWSYAMMDDLLDAGRIDMELYFKLTCHTIHLPALRERPVDIEEITRFVAASPETYGLARRMQGVELDLLVAELRRSELPENLRELIGRVRAASEGAPLIA